MKRLVVDPLPEVDGVIAIRGEPARDFAAMPPVPPGSAQVPVGPEKAG